MKKEAAFTTKFNQWAKKNLQPPCAVELKHTRGADAFPFRELKDHQKRWLIAAQSPNPQPYKISDQSAGIKPFDVVVFGMMYAYVVIKYPKCFVVIDIEKFLAEEKRSDRKSLTEARARAIAEHVV